MSSSRIALPRIFSRKMHTGGRPLPHPNLGGAAQAPSPQETASNLPPPPQSGDSNIDAGVPAVNELQAASEPVSAVGSSPTPHTGPTGGRDEFRAGLTPPNRTDLPMFTYKGKKIPVRPPRSIPVDLPSGFPEPKTWPPTQEYHDMVDGMTKAKRHPLWQFFHVSAGAAEKLSPGMEQPPEVGTFGPKSDGSDEANVNPGRAWSAPELRMKSFSDLHTLWYILLKERNILATQAEDKRRFGIPTDATRTEIGIRKHNIRKSMARIKFVLQERRLGLIAAVAPELDTTEPPPSWTDPARSFEAMRASELDVPDIRVPKMLRGVSIKAGAATVGDEQVNVEEVESRDEGFGGGREAEQFVNDTEVDADGRVKQAH